MIINQIFLQEENKQQSHHIHKKHLQGKNLPNEINCNQQDLAQIQQPHDQQQEHPSEQFIQYKKEYTCDDDEPKAQIDKNSTTNEQGEPQLIQADVNGPNQQQQELQINQQQQQLQQKQQQPPQQQIAQQQVHSGQQQKLLQYGNKQVLKQQQFDSSNLYEKLPVDKLNDAKRMCNMDIVENLALKQKVNKNYDIFKHDKRENEYSNNNNNFRSQSVSYTHLTLPTICSVQISVVAVSLKKKKMYHIIS
eukprot:TRINITY_DN10303_c0_g1_i1.p1 TRINITY_DN10303_c0_g1~~TRINITY_DN10303_c0_g1_i1.p1  ORF type:complete len:249 (-),score=63.96 TRINITY_DN10303_c0_g1_i1:62-808(-)